MQARCISASRAAQSARRFYITAYSRSLTLGVCFVLKCCSSARCLLHPLLHEVVGANLRGLSEKNYFVLRRWQSFEVSSCPAHHPLQQPHGFYFGMQSLRTWAPEQRARIIGRLSRRPLALLESAARRRRVFRCHFLLEPDPQRILGRLVASTFRRVPDLTSKALGRRSHHTLLGEARPERTCHPVAAVQSNPASCSLAALLMFLETHTASFESCVAALLPAGRVMWLKAGAPDTFLDAQVCSRPKPGLQSFSVCPPGSSWESPIPGRGWCRFGVGLAGVLGTSIRGDRLVAPAASC